jgi:hypothetical protein
MSRLPAQTAEPATGSSCSAGSRPTTTTTRTPDSADGPSNSGGEQAGGCQRGATQRHAFRLARVVLECECGTRQIHEATHGRHRAVARAVRRVRCPELDRECPKLDVMARLCRLQTERHSRRISQAAATRRWAASGIHAESVRSRRCCSGAIHVPVAHRGAPSLAATAWPPGTVLVRRTRTTVRPTWYCEPARAAAPGLLPARAEAGAPRRRSTAHRCVGDETACVATEASVVVRRGRQSRETSHGPAG